MPPSLICLPIRRVDRWTRHVTLAIALSLGGCSTVVRDRREDPLHPPRAPDALVACQPSDARSVPRDAFHKPNATRYVILDLRPSSPERQEEILLGRKAAGWLSSKLEDGLVDVVDPNATQDQRRELARHIEVVRLSCVPEDDTTARDIGLTMSADMVIWGESSCPLISDRGQPLVNIVAPIAQSAAATDGGTVTTGPMTVNLELPEEALRKLRDFEEGSFCFRAAITGRSLPAIRARDAKDVAASTLRTELALPPVVGGDAYGLIAFVAGLHFYHQEQYFLALRLFRSASTPLRSEAPGAADLVWMMGDTEMQAGDYTAAVRYFQGAVSLDRLRDKTWWKHRLSLLNAYSWAADTQAGNALANEILSTADGAEQDDDTLGFIHLKLSDGLNGLGRRREALESVLKSVEVYRRLVRRRPDTYETDLARSLSDLADAYNELGQSNEAEEALEQSVELYLRLARKQPSVFEMDLADALRNLASVLRDLHWSLSAREVAGWALEIHQRYHGGHETADAKQADSLNGLSITFRDLGMEETALKCIESTVEIDRRLVKDKPEAYELNLGHSLTNLASILLEMHQADRALDAIRESVQIQRRMVVRRPEAYSADLATKLGGLSLILTQAGRKEEALTAIQEAVGIHRRLAKLRPEIFEPLLGGSLFIASDTLAALGKKEEAVEAIQQTVELYSRLAKERPGVFGSVLQLVECWASQHLKELGKPKKSGGAWTKLAALSHKSGCRD
jgi:tetratricopeptide (TPR) repeat protein